MNLTMINDYSLIKKDKSMESLQTQNSLFIICPFCQLENYLQSQFGEDIYFLTSTAGVLFFWEDELPAIKEFIKREQIQNIYLVNDVGCNFIEEAIMGKKEFGMNAERQLRKLLQTIQPKITSEVSLNKTKRIIAESNLQQQEKYLASINILKHEVETLEIKIHTLIIDKHQSLTSNFTQN